MAKGARKKTKWVSLSLADGTSTAPPADHDAGSKSRGTKPSFLDDVQKPSGIDSPCVENSDTSIGHSSDRRSSWNNSNGQPYSNGYQRYPSRNYSSHFKSHNRNSYTHNSSSRKPYYNSYSGNGTYRSIANDESTAEAKNEQNSTVIINEDEYTKITTPRQDVLFKKGYLSRPKKHATISTNGNENGTITGNNSVNGTITDGSDVATASGSVSTAESVTSDSAYMTDGLFLDYTAPYPYFGYIDQSGVLVMNGFAVDNSGFPYMNGGQTYIYPTNYHCQSSFNEDVEIGEPNADGSELAASDDDKKQSSDTFNDVALVGGLSDSVPESTDEYLLDDQTRLNSISEENSANMVNVDGDSADLNQQVPQQLMLPPIANSFEYAQFYNSMYYPSCVLAPFPIVGSDLYNDQYGGAIEDEHSSQLSFRKRKKRYRNWDECPAEFFPDGIIDTTYHYPSASGMSENGDVDAANVTTVDAAFNTVPCDQAVPIHPPTAADNATDHNSSKELPSSQQSTPNDASTCLSTAVDANRNADRSQHQNQVSKPGGRQRSHAQKNRKRDIIESTRAFAEQNIDLTRPASLLMSAENQPSESSGWRTVRKGKEVKIQEDKENHSAPPQNKANPNSEKGPNEKLFYDDCKEEPTSTKCPSTTKDSKKQTIGRKGKKTAKGKGKKSKKTGFSCLQQGFELIEPEFPTSEMSIEIEHTTDDDDVFNFSNEKETLEEVEEIACESIETPNLNVEESVVHVPNTEDNEDYDEEDLEQDLRDVQISDLHIETADHVEDQHEDSISVDELRITCDSIVQTKDIANGKNIDVYENENNDIHEVPSKPREECESTDTLMCQSECPKPDVQKEDELTVVCNPCFDSVEDSSHDKTVHYHYDGDDEQQKCKHFTHDEYFENFDSGVQSPAAFTSSSSDTKERKSSTSSFGSQELQLTDAVTKWLSETLSNKRLEELFLLPEDPILLHRIHQFNVLNFDDSLVLSSDTYSSSSCDEADESVDSDYMSDVQAKNRKTNGLEVQQKTELKNDQLAEQTANGNHLANGGCHSNHKQKRCIIM